MALINCKECGYEMSTNADSCPNCGNKKEKNFYDSYWNWVFVLFNIFYLNVFSGIPIVFSITLASFIFMTPFVVSERFIDKPPPHKHKFAYIYGLTILSAIVGLIIYVYQLFTLVIGIGNEKYFYDLIYEFKEVLLGLYFLLPLLGNAFLYYRDRNTFDLDGVPSNPYIPLPLEDKNLLIKNIIELSGKTSWKAELEKLDIEALNDIHEKLNSPSKSIISSPIALSSVFSISTSSLIFIFFVLLIFYLQMLFFLSWFEYGFEHSNWIQLLNENTRLAFYIFGTSISLPIIFVFLCDSVVYKLRVNFDSFYPRNYRLGIGLNMLKVITVLPISIIVVEELSYTFALSEILNSFYIEQYFVYILIEIALGLLIALSLYYPLESFAIAQCKKIELEVLSIIAYKQPITWKEIEKNRKTKKYILEYLDDLLSFNLLLILCYTKDWVIYKEKSYHEDSLWTTTQQFLDDFNLESISDLPDLPDLNLKN